MSEQRSILADTVNRLFRDAAVAASSEQWNESLWRAVEEIGLPPLLVAEEAGGIGGNWEDAFVILRALGQHTVALPVAEAMLASRMAASAGLGLPFGVVTLAPKTAGRLDRCARSNAAHFTGELGGVPWGRYAGTVVGVVMQESEPYVVLLPRAAASSIDLSCNLAGEARDTLHYENAEVTAARSDTREALRLQEFAALLRVGQIAGALEAVLTRTIQYAKERTQFGKPIGNFQAVQQQLALLGAEAAAVGCAAHAAFRAADRAVDESDAAFEIAAAKLRANLAIDVSAAIAHQVHGAIGFTREYDLRRATQRLWSWRTEFGNDRHWSSVLGGAVAARGADAFWSDLTRRGDRAAERITA